MKFFQYLESVYASSNIEVQKEYTAFKHAETQAIQDLINGQRKVFKFFAYIMTLINYLLVVMYLKKAPLTATEIIKQMNDENMAKAQKLKEEQEANKLALVSNQTLTS